MVIPVLKNQTIYTPLNIKSPCCDCTIYLQYFSVCFAHDQRLKAQHERKCSIIHQNICLDLILFLYFVSSCVALIEAQKHVLPHRFVKKKIKGQ